MDEEQYVNLQVTATLNAEQYTTLVAAMTDWCTNHPEEADAIRELKSIEFVRTR
jgi:hypothetical protein